VSKFSTNFEEILSRAPGNFEGQNKVLESSINYYYYIIIIIIIKYNYKISVSIIF